MSARRCNTTEAYRVLTDLTLTQHEAVKRAGRLVRGLNQINQVFVLGTGQRFREIAAQQRFEENQIARWADDGGAA